LKIDPTSVKQHQTFF